MTSVDVFCCTPDPRSNRPTSQRQCRSGERTAHPRSRYPIADAVLRMSGLLMKGQIMTAVMSWIDYWNRKVKDFTIFDVKLAQGAAMGFILIIVKLFHRS